MPHRHHHGHAHHHAHDQPQAHGTGQRRRGPPWRYLVAAGVVMAALAAGCIAVNDAGQALVVSWFGAPVRIIVQPGLTWKLPPPFETLIAVDLRLHTTSSGLQDVGTRDGLRIVTQSFVAWQVAADPASVVKYLRSTRGEADEAARRLRSRMASALEVATSGFDLTDLVAADASPSHLDQLEGRLADHLSSGLGDELGIAVRQVGLERLTLPPDALQATVARMKAERETVAAERTRGASRAAAQIRSDADRDARLAIAQAKAQAADVEAKARVEAARLYGEAYRAAPDLYRLVRSLDTLDKVVGENTRLILRTDAAPFDVLVSGAGAPPPAAPGPTPALPAPSAGPGP